MIILTVELLDGSLVSQWTVLKPLITILPFPLIHVVHQNVSELAPDTVLHSTTVATANTSMTGAVVECKDSAGILSKIIGNITLCVIGE